VFTGLYFELKYYRILNTVWLYKKGTYDYYVGKEEICGVRSADIFVKWCWSINQAKQLTASLNSQIVKG
jgi:hypothetical protein